jgi:uncharacterized protein (TIGR03083 family)
VISDQDVAAAVATNRRLVADFFDELDDDQLATQSLCEAWSVRQVLGHLVTPFTMSLGSFAVEVLRSRGSVARATVATAVRLGERPVRELTADLRQHADAGARRPMGDLADLGIHLRDCARPLGLPHDVGLAHWRVVLDWLPTTKAHMHVRLGTVDGLSFRASDQPWSWGEGPEVVGTSEALALGITGRPAALDELVGSGAGELRRRLS